jgi:hypothetical protein
MPLAFAGFELQTVWFDRWVCGGFAFATGALVAAYSIYFSATVQALVPASLRGRFAALRRMVSTTIVGSASYCYTLGYARDGVRGASVVALSISLFVFATCALWVVWRRILRARFALTAIPLPEDIGHTDLAPLFQPLLHLSSTDRR